MLTILHALKQWHPYLIGIHFKVKTNHDSLKYFLEQMLSSKEQQKWVTKLHGTPNITVSEMDPIFTRNFWPKLFSCLGTQLAHRSSYHPQYDGQTEIVNKCLEGYL